MSLIWPRPISLRYHLNLRYGSRQIMANQIGPDDHNASDWSVTKWQHEGLHVLNAKSCAECNAATISSRIKLAVDFLRIDILP